MNDAESNIWFQVIRTHLVLSATRRMLLRTTSIVLLISFVYSWFLFDLTRHMIIVLSKRQTLNLILKAHLTIHLSFKNTYTFSCNQVLIVRSTNNALALHLIVHIDAISSIYSLLLGCNMISRRWNSNHTPRDSSLHHFIVEAKTRVRSVVARWPVSVVAILH